MSARAVAAREAGTACIAGPRFEIARGDPEYPAALEALSKPPETLYLIGDIQALQEGLAVVGARNATPYGRSAARLLAGCAARMGICVISGGARGCDSYAHEAAIEAGGRTVAFLGGGCDVVYPSCNKGLFNRIVESGGAVVSEHPWSFPPKPYTFRARNRLIASLARATLVVEAGVPSGTFSTADEALAANKDVLAVPGSIFSPTSRGSNALIAQGAGPVVDEAEFEELLTRLFPEKAYPNGRAAQLTMLFSREEGGCAAPSTGGSSSALKACDDADGLVISALRADPMRLEQLVEEFATGESGPFATVGDLMASVFPTDGSGACVPPESRRLAQTRASCATALSAQVCVPMGPSSRLPGSDACVLCGVRRVDGVEERCGMLCRWKKQ